MTSAAEIQPLTVSELSPHRRWWLFEKALPLVSHPPEPQPALRPNICSVFMPGFSAARAQAARYTGPDPVTVLDRADNDRVLYQATAACAPRLLHNVLPQPEVHDIEHIRSLLDLLWNPTAVVSLAIKRVQNAALRMSGAANAHMVLTRVNIGGRLDQEDCRRAIERGAAEARRTGRHLVVMGCSRGAATMLSTVLTLEPETAAAISLVIVEAPFDTVEDVVRGTSYFPRTVLALMRTIGRYEGRDRHSTPLRTIESLSPSAPVALTAPVAFITSKIDTRVPPAHTARVMALLAERQPQLRLHHLELQKSNHSAMAISNDADRDAYIAFLEDLYDKYCK